MVEFLEDLIQVDAGAAFPRSVRETDSFILPTGDREVDKWQKDQAIGKVPDVLSSFKGEDLALMKKMLGVKPEEPLPDELPVEGWNDHYGADS